MSCRLVLFLGSTTFFKDCVLPHFPISCHNWRIRCLGFRYIYVRYPSSKVVHVSHGLSAVCCFFWPGIFSLSFCLRVKFCTRERITWTKESVASGCRNYIPQYTDVFDINEKLLWLKFSNHIPSYMVLWVTATCTRATSAF